MLELSLSYLAATPRDAFYARRLCAAISRTLKSNGISVVEAAPTQSQTEPGPCWTIAGQLEERESGKRIGTSGPTFLSVLEHRPEYSHFEEADRLVAEYIRRGRPRGWLDPLLKELGSSLYHRGNQSPVIQASPRNTGNRTPLISLSSLQVKAVPDEAFSGDTPIDIRLPVVAFAHSPARGSSPASLGKALIFAPLLPGCGVLTLCAALEQSPIHLHVLMPSGFIDADYLATVRAFCDELKLKGSLSVTFEETSPDADIGASISECRCYISLFTGSAEDCDALSALGSGKSIIVPVQSGLHDEFASLTNAFLPCHPDTLTTAVHAGFYGPSSPDARLRVIARSGAALAKQIGSLFQVPQKCEGPGVPPQTRPTKEELTKEEVASASAISTSGHNLETLVPEAYRLAQTGDTKGAIQLLLLAIEKRAHPALAARLLSILHAGSQDLSKAIKAIDTSLHFDPKAWESHKIKGELLEAQGNWYEARLCYVRTLALNPDQRESLLKLLKLSRDLHLSTDLRWYVETFLQNHPGDTEMERTAREASLGD